MSYSGKELQQGARPAHMRPHPEGGGANGSISAEIGRRNSSTILINGLPPALFEGGGTSLQAIWNGNRRGPAQNARRQRPGDRRPLTGSLPFRNGSSGMRKSGYRLFATIPL